MTMQVRALDHTIQDSNLWLKDLQARLGVTRQEAYSGLRAVLHTLRDRLPSAVAMHFACQLPTLIRGMFVEGWDLGDPPTGDRSAVAFADRIAQALPLTYPVDPETVARAVFQLLFDRMDAGETDKVRRCLPRAIGRLWEPAVQDLE